jgi:hypothetical protein
VMPRDADVIISGGGTIYLFRPLNASASDWVAGWVCGERQLLGNALAVEHRYARDLAQAMAEDGLRIRFDWTRA